MSFVKLSTNWSCSKINFYNTSANICGHDAGNEGTKY